MLRGQNNFTDNKKIRIKIINDLCISAGICVIAAPNTFELDENGIAYVKETTWDDAKDIIEAAKDCPTFAIIIEDMEGNQIFPEN